METGVRGSILDKRALNRREAKIMRERERGGSEENREQRLSGNTMTTSSSDLLFCVIFSRSLDDIWYSSVRWLIRCLHRGRAIVWILDGLRAGLSLERDRTLRANFILRS
jgi:hypothetical protein